MMERRRALLEGARLNGYDSLVACTPENLYYMTGFWGEAIGILDGNGTRIVAPALEAQRASDESHRCEVVVAERGAGLVPAASALLEGGSPCTDCRDYSTMLSLKRHAPHMKNDPRPFSATRAVKDDGEIRTLREASRLIDSLFGVCAAEMAPGQSESRLQAILMERAAGLGLFDTGYPSTLNPLIVAGGPNGALPHAQPTGRKFCGGDLVVVDITLRHNGYVSDATRTFAVGGVSREAVDVYDAVRESQTAGLRAAVEGATCGAVDAACRDRITEGGHGEFFIHSTGHGVGLEVHEPPAVSKDSETPLRRGMAITVEPGIYMPGRMGVRIEDTIVVGQAPDVLHCFTKDLVRV